MLKKKVKVKRLNKLLEISGGYFFTSIVNQAIPFMVLPILTRYMAPAEYGKVALFNLSIALFNVFIGLALPQIITKHFFDSKKEDIARLVGNSVAVSFAITLLMVLASMLMLEIFYKEIHFAWAFVSPLTSFTFVIFGIGLSILRNQKKVILFSVFQLTNTALNIGASLFLIVALLLSWKGRVLGIVGSYTISAISILVYLKNSGYIDYSISQKGMLDIIRVFLPLTPSSFNSIFISQIGIIFIQHYFGDDTLGIYSVGLQVSFAMYFLSVTLQMSWNPFFFEALSNQNKFNQISVAKILLVMVGLLFIGLLCLNIFKSFILQLMTTQEYYSAVEYIPWLSASFFLMGLQAFFLPVLIKYNQEKYLQTISLVGAGMIFVLTYLLANITGAVGVAYALCIVHLVLSVLIIRKAHKIFPLPYSRVIKILR